MSKIEITIMLITIVYGLMLTELFASLHKLLRVRKIVKWHWLPLLASWFLFSIMIKDWWYLHIYESSQLDTLYFFMIRSHILLLFYLLVSTSLPDKIPKEGINLKDYYFKNHKYFWGLMVAIGLSWLLFYIIGTYIQNSPILLSKIIMNTVLIFLFLTLALTKRYWIHSIIVIFLVVLIVLEIITS